MIARFWASLWPFSAVPNDVCRAKARLGPTDVHTKTAVGVGRRGNTLA
ncbi:MAG: hypothetical protein IPM53_31410 [Anaerolineaceae bacterium]|nr:hypothetical protein [Anaerolineaceae bacterium]